MITRKSIAKLAPLANFTKKAVIPQKLNGFPIDFFTTEAVSM